MPFSVGLGVLLMFCVIVVGLAIVLLAIGNVVYRSIYRVEKRLTARLFSPVSAEEPSSVVPPNVWDRELDGMVQIPPVSGTSRARKKGSSKKR
jgi:hypothetical protein